MREFTFTVEQTNLISIYKEDGISKQDLIKNINIALPFMDKDIKELANKVLEQIETMTEEEYAGFNVYPADEA